MITYEQIRPLADKAPHYIIPDGYNGAKTVVGVVLANKQHYAVHEYGYFRISSELPHPMAVETELEIGDSCSGN